VGEGMSDKIEYFDIRKLFKVMDANGWSMGKNFMKFWADGKAKIAVVGAGKSKSTIGTNLNQGLCTLRMWVCTQVIFMSSMASSISQPGI
jgi:hypothetical protein